MCSKYNVFSIYVLSIACVRYNSEIWVSRVASLVRITTFNREHIYIEHILERPGYQAWGRWSWSLRGSLWEQAAGLSPLSPLPTLTLPTPPARYLLFYFLFLFIHFSKPPPTLWHPDTTCSMFFCFFNHYLPPPTRTLPTPPVRCFLFNYMYTYTYNLETTCLLHSIYVFSMDIHVFSVDVCIHIFRHHLVVALYIYILYRYICVLYSAYIHYTYLDTTWSLHSSASTTMWFVSMIGPLLLIISSTCVLVMMPKLAQIPTTHKVMLSPVAFSYVYI